MFVSISKIIFLAVLAASYFICEDVSAVTYSNYVEISNHLSKTIPQEDPQTNLKAAGDWCAELETSNGPKQLIEALNLFTSMNNALRLDSCKREGHYILLQNELATTKKSRSVEIEIKTRRPFRADLVVNQVCKQHAKLCFSAHIENFKVAQASLDKTTAQRVETFTDLLIEEHFLKGVAPSKSKSLVLFEALKGKPQIVGFGDAKLAIKALEILAKEDPEVQSLQSYRIPRSYPSTSYKIEVLFEKYLVEPCREYYRKLGPDVFKPAQFDQIYEPSQFDDKEVEFYTGWVRYALCEDLILIGNEKLLDACLHEYRPL